MTKCKQCKAIISLDLADLISGKFKAPKRISQSDKNYCDECFKAIKK